MRRSPVLLAVALLAGVIAVGSPAAPTVEAAGTPPPCPAATTKLFRCNRYLNTNVLGSVGLIGDSVLQGSADGMSNPGLPKMLSDQGFGPINLLATQGMVTYKSGGGTSSGYHMLDYWKANGFSPDIIVVNLGANHFTTCTAGNPAPCKTKIDQLLDRIATHFPTTIVWWAKINYEPYGQGNGYGTGMLGWNTALDQAATQRPNLMLWDWPTALLNANPTILMDTPRIHPNSGVQYVKRSTLMAADIIATMAPARYLGPRATLPAGEGTGYGFTPVAPEAVYTTPTNGARFTATETRTVDLSGSPLLHPDATAVALTVTSVGPDSGGWLTVWRCGDTMPPTSNVNFATGESRTAQVITRISEAGEVCVYASTGTDVIISMQGNFLDGAGSALLPITPVRPLDSRLTGRAQQHTVAVPGTNIVGAAVTVTTVGASPGGSVSLYACDDPQSTVANVSFLPNETVASAAFVPVSAAGTICVYINTPTSQYTDVIVDITGVFGDTGLRFVPAPGTRMLDTRNGIGGWVYRHRFMQTVDTLAAPPGAKAVTGTITVVRPQFRAFLTAHACGLALPPTSSVNANAGMVMANSITVGVNATQQTLCIYSSRNTHTLFDVVGWWVEATA